MRHYDRLAREEIKQIERVANEMVRANHSVSQEWPHRNDAEAEYGFDLYQGGIPPGTNIRLIHVGDDTQACGGTHISRTGEIGTIKIRSTEPVQDGIERITFAAGEAAIEATQTTEDALYEAADVLDVNPEDVPDTAERFFTEWKERGKELDRLKDELAEVRATAGTNEVEINGQSVVVQRLDSDIDELRATANALVEEGSVAVLGSGAGDSAQFVVGVPDDAGINAGEVVGELAGRVGGGGGGPPDFAQGGGPDVDALDDVLEDAPEILRGVLNV